MARSATRTANVFTRVDPETKEQAEAILNETWYSYVQCNRNVSEAGCSSAWHSF